MIETEFCFYQFSVFGGKIYILGEMERRVFRGWVVKGKAIELSLQVLHQGCNVLYLKRRNKGVVFITVGGPHSAAKCGKEDRGIPC